MNNYHITLDLVCFSQHAIADNNYNFGRLCDNFGQQFCKLAVESGRVNVNLKA